MEHILKGHGNQRTSQEAHSVAPTIHFQEARVLMCSLEPGKHGMCSLSVCQMREWMKQEKQAEKHWGKEGFPRGEPLGSGLSRWHSPFLLGRTALMRPCLEYKLKACRVLGQRHFQQTES